MLPRTYDVPGMGRMATTKVHAGAEPEVVAALLWNGDALVLLDPALLANPGVLRLLSVSDPTISIVLLDSNETTKSVEMLQRFNNDTLEARSAGWVIGGGSLINFAYYAFARLPRSRSDIPGRLSAEQHDVDLRRCRRQPGHAERQSFRPQERGASDLPRSTDLAASARPHSSRRPPNATPSVAFRGKPQRRRESRFVTIVP